MKRWLVALLGLAALLGLSALWFLLPSPQEPALPPAPPPEQPRALTPFEVAEFVYDGGLREGWEDWGWGPHELPKSGQAHVNFASFGGLVLHSRRELPPPFGALVFHVRAPEGFGWFLSVCVGYKQLGEATFPIVPISTRHVATLPDGAQEIRVDMSELNPANSPIDSITIKAKNSVGTDWVLLDKIVLTKADGAAKHATSRVRGVELTVDCSLRGHRIDALVYGAASETWENGESAHRIGGNPITRLNWDLGNVWNTGSDWFFQNTKGSDQTVWQWLEDGARRGKPSALLVPMIGWVAKDTTSVGFPRARFGQQRKHDPYRAEAGDGHRPDGTPLAPGPPSETSAPVPPEVIARWLTTLREKDRSIGRRSVLMYILDNEPSLWDQTHRDVHPEPLSYDELLDRTVRYASAIRGTDPEIPIAGPAEWGWSGYFYSAVDRAKGFSLMPDRRAHGDKPLVAWYLAKLREHELKTGVRLLDVLDLHFYPAADGVYGGDARTDAAGSALRIRSTRALWDPNYRDESWIKDRIRLIPRMKEWVAENYPGRKTMIGEWSFGADDHISGALAAAEALGRFGEQGLDAAFYHGGPKPNSAVSWAFRAYRNYDGKGARFQDFSVPTRGTSESVSLFASRDEAGKRVVAVLLNLDPSSAVRARVDVSSCGEVTQKRAFSYGAGKAALGEEPKAGAESDDVELVPPYSVRVIELVLK